MTATKQIPLKQFKLNKKIIVKFASLQKPIDGANSDNLATTTFTIPTIQSTVY